MQKLERFQFANVLDINRCYYNISLLPVSQDMKTIVTEFGKCIYNNLPMGMCASGDIFQAILFELIGDIEGIKTYIYDILVLSKEILSNHI